MLKNVKDISIRLVNRCIDLIGAYRGCVQIGIIRDQ